MNTWCNAWVFWKAMEETTLSLADIHISKFIGLKNSFWVSELVGS